MRTTVNIDNDLLAEVVAETGERDRGRAINKAMAEFVRRKKMERLLASRGAFPDMRDRREWHDVDLKLELEHGKQS